MSHPKGITAAVTTHNRQLAAPTAPLKKLRAATQLSDYWKIGHSSEINEQFSVRA